LKGKDEVIAALNRSIESLLHQLDEQPHLGDCHKQDNPMQRIVESLTAENLKLEAQLTSLEKSSAQ
jgi:hypothetical protein